jgi:hypothetical protein
MTVGQALDRVLAGLRVPRSITVDHGTEFMSRALEDWAYRRGVQLDIHSTRENRWKIHSSKRSTDGSATSFLIERLERYGALSTEALLERRQRLGGS